MVPTLCFTRTIVLDGFCFSPTALLFRLVITGYYGPKVPTADCVQTLQHMLSTHHAPYWTIHTDDQLYVKRYYMAFCAKIIPHVLYTWLSLICCTYCMRPVSDLISTLQTLRFEMKNVGSMNKLNWRICSNNLNQPNNNKKKSRWRVLWLGRS